jgi:peptidoglycan/LPS O-acetylase OafA/YrhL
MVLMKISKLQFDIILYKSQPKITNMIQPVNHTNNFDFIRFLAASFVIITHAYPLKNLPDGNDLSGQLIGELYPFSFFGVRIFFLISGYLILQSFDRKKSNLDYMWKRCLRILPGLFVLILLMVFVYGPFFSFYSAKEYFSNPQTYQMLWSVVLYRINGFLPGVFNIDKNTELLGSLWTLPYEFSMYIGIMILSFFRILNKKYFNLITWICLINICVFYPTYFKEILGHSYIPFLRLSLWNTIEFSNFFLGGMLLYQFKDMIKYRFTIFLTIIILFSISIYFNNQFIVRVIIYSLLPYFIFYLGNIKGWLNRFGKYGDLSYGIYIYGFPVQQMLVFLTKNELSVLELQILSFIVVLPLAFLSWHLVEKRALTFKNIFSESHFS